MGFGGQRRLAILDTGPLPAFDAGNTHPDKSGGFCERLPCLEILRSTTTSSFQLRRAAFGSHYSYYGASGGVGSIAAQFSIKGPTRLQPARWPPCLCVSVLNNNCLGH